VPGTTAPRTVFLVTNGRNAVRDQILPGDTSREADPELLVPDIAALSLDELDGLDSAVLARAVRRLLTAVDRSDPPVAGFNSAI
jgi:FXSXX-COOH protein